MPSLVITGHIPAALGKITTLRYLSLAGNLLSGERPNKFERRLKHYSLFDEVLNERLRTDMIDIEATCVSVDIVSRAVESNEVLCCLFIKATIQRRLAYICVVLGSIVAFACRATNGWLSGPQHIMFFVKANLKFQQGFNLHCWRDSVEPDLCGVVVVSLPLAKL